MLSCVLKTVPVLTSGVVSVIKNVSVVPKSKVPSILTSLNAKSKEEKSNRVTPVVEVTVTVVAAVSRSQTRLLLLVWPVAAIVSTPLPLVEKATSGVPMASAGTLNVPVFGL